MGNEKVTRLLLEFNAFWKSPMQLEYKERAVYTQLKKLVSEPQVISLCGLRRVGKTTLLKKIIYDLLKDYAAGSVLYFSFDDFPGSELFDIIDAHKEIHGVEPKFLFFDEIQKLPSWAEKIKVLYDTKKYKIFLSGSESLFLRKGSRESLAGRIYEFEIKGLTFREYLGFAGKSRLAAKPILYGAELQREFERYLLTAGFPELIGKEDHNIAKQYIRDAVVEKIVFMDASRLYPLENPPQLLSILEIVLDNPGMTVDFNAMSHELGMSRQTISKYFDVLEKAHLVLRLYNFSRNKSTSEKKLKRYYPTFLSPVLAENKDASYIGKVVETACVVNTGAKFFWRDKYKDEVDLVLLRNSKLIPVEVKYRNEPRKNKGLEKFCKKYGCGEAIVVTKGVRKTSKNFATEQWVPAFEFLLKFS